MANGDVVFVDRRNTDCGKWDGLKDTYGRDGLQAMWVADMDFKAPECVLNAINDYIKTGVFGYYKPRESYAEAFIDWERKYHGYEVKKEWVRFSPGVVPAINWLLHFMTNEGDAVIVQTPIYYPFMDGVKHNKRKLIMCDLVNTNGVYTIDFDAFEKQIAENDVKVFIMSSPHNPSGRVWTKEELKTMLDICRKHNVFVIADEIHQDIVFSGTQIPAATVGDYDDMLVTLTAASKTFNLAALQNSFIVIPNAELRAKYDEFKEGIRLRQGNPFGYVAAEAAYRYGREWFENVKKIIYGNYLYIKDTFAARLPKAVVTPLEATYLMWIDLGAYVSAENMHDFIQNKCELAFDYGDWFGGERFGTHVRINLATSREMVEKAAERIIANIEQ